VNKSTVGRWCQRADFRAALAEARQVPCQVPPQPYSPRAARDTLRAALGAVDRFGSADWPSRAKAAVKLIELGEDVPPAAVSESVPAVDRGVWAQKDV
jgi:hypothetical protein